MPVTFSKKKLLALLALFSTTFALWLSYGTHVEATIDPTFTSCRPPQPIKITVKNYTFSTILRATFKTEFFRDGRTTDVSGFWGGRITFDKAVAPFSTETMCVSHPYISKYMDSHKIEGRKSQFITLAETMAELNAYPSFQKIIRFIYPIKHTNLCLANFITLEQSVVFWSFPDAEQNYPRAEQGDQFSTTMNIGIGAERAWAAVPLLPTDLPCREGYEK